MLRRRSVAVVVAKAVRLCSTTGGDGKTPAPPCSTSSTRAAAGAANSSTSVSFSQALRTNATDGAAPQPSSGGITSAVGSGEGDVIATPGKFAVKDHGPARATGLWKVEEVVDTATSSVHFAKIDDIESDLAEDLAGRGDALVPYQDEEAWKHKLLFVYKFKKTPKHLTWKELGQEIECLDCVIEPDPHRPEEIFTIQFQFLDRKRGVRDVVWKAKNDVSYSEGFTDLMAALGSCLGRSDVYRTIRFDDGQGTTREICFRKKSRYTSDIQISFRPAVKYNLYERKEEVDTWEASMQEQGLSTWGFHPQLMDPEYQDTEDPEETYIVSMSAHALSFVFLRAVERLLSRPLKDFYRPSQLLRTVKIAKEEDIGLGHAVKGWLGIDDQIYPHYLPIEAIQDYWLGKDAPFTLVAVVNKLREMAYLKKRNPEFVSWLSVRQRDTTLALRNISVKMLGAGASSLFLPVGHNSTVNRLLPKSQQRRIDARVSLNATLGMPDETRKLADFKKLTGRERVLSEGGGAAPMTTRDPPATENATDPSPPALPSPPR